MKKEEIINKALINALGTAIYVIAIASFLYFGGQGIFGDTPTILAPIAMLMLFVFSAAFTGFLMLGKPILMYLDGKKREAVSLFLYSLGIFLVITIIALFLLIFLSQ